MDCSIIIVSWNVETILQDCLDSILSATVAVNTPDGDKPVVEIIVVDSASQDNTVQMVRDNYPQVRLLPQDDNIGFTRGNNIGLEEATGRYLFLLNPDTEVIGGAINQMIAYLDAHPQTGIVGPHTLNTDGSTQSSRRRFPTKLTAFFESTWLQGFAPRSLLDEFYITQPPDDAVIPVDWVQGSALMARREVYDDIGGLDAGFVMYSEELDWCKRAKDAGWQVVYLGTAQITHHGGKSSEQASTRKHIWFQQSKIRYFRKHHGRFFAAILYLFLYLNYVVQLVLESVKGLLGSKRAMRRERIRMYWQVLKSGFRPESSG
jgi:hypothetical protein